ncbi:MAG: hypothetical protein AB7O88_09015 [Reyranellaceae bacterium]
MSDTLPQPLTPPDCDLRGLEWMPFYGHRLFASDFDAHADDAVFRAALSLWWSAWNQVPAASLPDDDVALCRLAGLGRDVAAWRAMRAQALHGFVPCADGRLYHRALSAMAMVSWDRRQKDRSRRQRWKEKAAGDRRANVCGDVPGDVPGTADGTGRDETRWDSIAAQPPPVSEGRRTANGLRQARADDLGLPASMREATTARRLKRQDIADRDMVRWLTSEGGMDGERAWGLLFAARDPDDAGHVDAARELERISRAHRLGWFAHETEAA